MTTPGSVSQAEERVSRGGNMLVVSTVGRTLFTANALIRLVLVTCGPRHRSIRVPHRYTVDEPPSGIFSLIKCTLSGLYWHAPGQIGMGCGRSGHNVLRWSNGNSSRVR